MVLEGVTLAMLIAANPGEPETRAELEACAGRIEELKARRRAGEPVGGELERLLVRAQELAARIDGASAPLPPPAPAPSPEELRERADAARDEADRLSSELALLDVKIGDLRRILRSESNGVMPQAALGRRSGSTEEERRLEQLQSTRAALSRQRERVLQTAARLEAEAARVEADR